MLRLIAVLVQLSCFIAVFANPNWNDLKVTWGPDPSSANFFVSLPRDQVLAANKGWVLSKKDCSRVSGTGNRYYTNGDLGLQLVFDINGILAGVASAIPKNLPFNFPSKSIQPYLIEEANFYTITAYFADPNTICQPGHSSISDRLIIKGQSASMSIPLTEVEALAERKWTRGNCFNTMGHHYWLDINEKPVGLDTNKDDFFPMFLLYNNGKLNGFGFAFNADVPSPRFEHPTVPVISYFMTPVPKFFSDVTQSKVISTLHIYLDNQSPITYTC